MSPDPALESLSAGAPVLVAGGGVTGRAVLAACSEGDALRTNLAVLKRFTKFEPVDAIAVRRRIAGRLLQAERYVV